MAFLANLYPLRQLLYGYPILLYGVMLSIACACLLKWEETGVPGGNPRKHGENMQTPHRKARAGPETNPGPSCCEATALTTAPPCRPRSRTWRVHPTKYPQSMRRASWIICKATTFYVNERFEGHYFYRLLKKCPGSWLGAFWVY